MFSTTTYPGTSLRPTGYLTFSQIHCNTFRKSNLLPFQGKTYKMNYFRILGQNIIHIIHCFLFSVWSVKASFSSLLHSLSQNDDKKFIRLYSILAQKCTSHLHYTGCSRKIDTIRILCLLGTCRNIPCNFLRVKFHR